MLVCVVAATKLAGNSTDVTASTTTAPIPAVKDQVLQSHLARLGMSGDSCLNDVK